MGTTVTRGFGGGPVGHYCDWEKRLRCVLPSMVFEADLGFQKLSGDPIGSKEEFHIFWSHSSTQLAKSSALRAPSGFGDLRFPGLRAWSGSDAFAIDFDTPGGRSGSESSRWVWGPQISRFEGVVLK